MTNEYLEFRKQHKNLSIRDRIKMSYSHGIKHDHIKEQQLNREDILFKKSDILTAKNCLLKLVRLFIHKLGLTSREYTERAKQYNIALGNTHTKALNIANNSKSTITVPLRQDDKDNLTGKSFQKIVEYLGYDLIDLSMTVQDTLTGEIITHKLSDIPSLVEMDVFDKIMYDKRKSEGSTSDDLSVDEN